MKIRNNIREINAGSMADIAFLLLIFFLVATTVDVDSGISTKLPPAMTTPPKQIPMRNILEVRVNGNGELLVEGEYAELEDLRQMARDFIDNNGDKSCDHCNGEGLASSSDNPKKAVISVQTDRQTSYKTFIAVQNELLAAYNELRSELSEERFNESFDNLEDGPKKQIQQAYPVIISEAEPLKLNAGIAQAN